MARNSLSLDDAYGDSPDWIEIFNDAPSAVDLAGYHLTDDAANLGKWEFPATTVLDPGDYLIVFASNRDELDPAGNYHTNFELGGGGEYLALTAPDQTILTEYGSDSEDYPPQVTDISFGVAGTVLVDHDSVAEYWVPDSDVLGDTWTANGFDGLDNGFALGRAAIGYESSPGSATSYVSSIQSAVDPGTTNVYARMEFDVDSAADVSDLHLHLKVDDGAVVYLNGTQVWSFNDPTPISYNTPAASGHDDTSALAGIDVPLDSETDLLVDGTNTLAIHALNRPGSSDFLIAPRLTSQSIAGNVGYLEDPTPGFPNSLQQELGPLISEVTETSTATAGLAMVVTADVDDFTDPTDTSSVRLHYRIMFGGETTVTMVDDGTGADTLAGDGTYSATIPGTALIAGEMVRWFVTASDQTGIDSRSPRFLDPLDSPQYYGALIVDPAITTDLPQLHWFLENPSAASTTAGTRSSLFLRGEFFDNIQVDNHGQSTRGSAFPKKSFDFDANSGNKFRVDAESGRVSDFNLLTNYADQTKLRNTLTYDLFAQADYAHHYAFSVMVYRNGEFYGLYDIVEEGDTEYLDRLGLDPENALYKVNNRLNSASTNVEKKSREWEDHSDFQQLIDGVQTLSGTDAILWDFEHVDIADMVNYLAVHNVAVSSDFGHKNMYWYRDTNGTGLWSPFPWDQDLSLGHQWDAGISPPYFKDDLVTDLNIYLGGNNLFQRLYANPTFKEMYTRRVRSLADQFYGVPGSDVADSYLATHITQLEALIADEAVEDMNAWGIQANFTHTPAQAADQLIDEFIPLRRSYIDNHVDVPASQSATVEIRFDEIDYDADPLSGLQSEEYVRLNNPTDAAVDISGWRLADGISHTFKGGTVIPAGGALFVVKDVSAFHNRSVGRGGGQGLFVQGNYSGQLSYNGETVQLLDRSGALIDSLTTPPAAPTELQRFLRISEIAYHPVDTDAEFIEVTNVSHGLDATTLDLTGVTITDGPSAPFVFAAGTMLGPGERLVVVQNLAGFTAAHPTVSPLLIAGQYSGKLANGGERLKLIGAGAETIADIEYGDGDPWAVPPDGVGPSLQLINESTVDVSRQDKPYSWRASSPTAGTPGTAPQPTLGVRINEILAHTDAPQVDAIELHNTTGAAVDIGGWFLSDSSNDLLKYRIPDGTTIAAGSYLVFDESDFNPTPLTPGPDDFALSGSNGDSVWLVVPDAGETSVTSFVDHVEFGATFNGVSLGRLPDGAGRLTPLESPSLGSVNTVHAVAAVTISEVHYHPSAPSPAELALDPDLSRSDLEFVEIHNRTNLPVDLTRWTVRGDGDFDFADGQSLAGNGRLVLVQFDPQDVASAGRLAAFRLHHGIDDSVSLVGPLQGTLGDSFGLVKLRQPDASPVDEPTVMPSVLVDEVLYDDLSPWPIDADGLGQSLQRRGSTLRGNDASSWQAAVPTPGITHYVPGIESIVINDGADTRSAITSVEVRFDAEVTAPTSAFELTNTTTGQQVTSLVLDTTTLDGKTTTRITFDPGPQVHARMVGENTLTDGDYQLRIVASSIAATAGGANLDADETLGDHAADRFFRKYGDLDGNDLVNLFDFVAFRSSYFKSEGDPLFRGDLDSDGDGLISIIDFVSFRANYNT